MMKVTLSVELDNEVAEKIVVGVLEALQEFLESKKADK